jgi:hypothetical protein
LKNPIFFRENLYDSAKLANCGFTSGRNGASDDTEYLKAWGKWMRAQLAIFSISSKDGFYSASCLDHCGNTGFDSSPVINGVSLRDALSNWYFEKGNRTMQYTYDDCGDLPCTQATGSERCPHYDPPGPSPGPSPTISPSCKAEFASDCPGMEHEGAECAHCISSHKHKFISAGCPESGWTVMDFFCSRSFSQDVQVRAGGHYVCELSDRARERHFGDMVV